MIYPILIYNNIYMDELKQNTKTSKNKLLELFTKAQKLGSSDFGPSNLKNKRYYVIYNNKKINFGSAVGLTFNEHGDINKRNAWRARHSKILLKDGTPAYKNKMSPAYWAYHLLW